MTGPIRNEHAHRATDLARDAQAGAEHTGQTMQARGFMRVKVQHTKMQRARMQHNQMLSAAFYRGKRFAEGNRKSAPPSAQKLMRQLGERPRPGSASKARGKEGAARERPELAHGAEHKREAEHDREHPHEHEGGQQKKREHEREHEQRDQQHRGGHGHEQKHDGGQSQQNAPRDGQPKREHRDSREEREKREKRDERGKPRKFAIAKAGKAKAAARRQPLDSAMQVLARQRLGTPDLPSELARACTKAVLRLTSRLELGPLLAVPLLLSMTSPMALRRNAARLAAHRGASLAQQAANPSKAAATAGLIGLSLDNTLARQSAGIQYSDGDQSIAMVKQRILDALAAASTAAPAGTGATPRGAASASDTTREVRTAPAGPEAKP
jgi:hypothetical protein